MGGFGRASRYEGYPEESPISARRRVFGAKREQMSNYQEKIVTLAELLTHTDEARRGGRRIVQCHGCFDIVHPGHIRYLEFARQQGDLLIVSLTGDSDITKGAQRPYIPQELRAENLAALMFVDYVYVDPNPTAETVLAQVKPDLYVKGREYEHSTSPDFLAEKRVVEGYGGRILFSSGEIIFSSTDLIERIADGDNKESHRVAHVTNRYAITPQSIDQTMNRFRELRVLVVGDIVVDRYVSCDALGIASEAPMMTLVERDQRTFVGGAAIVARHVAAMGASAVLFGAGGSDPQSQQVADLLKQEGIVSHLTESRPSFVEKTRFLVDRSKVFKVDRGSCLPLDSVAERRVAATLEEQAKSADAVIFCDFGYGMITGTLLSRVLPTLRHNVPIITADVSGGSASMLNFHHVDLLCPTERELRTMLNDHQSGLSAVAWEMLKHTQARHIFVTLEKHGMVVFDRRSQDRSNAEWSGRLKSEQLPTFAEHAVDHLGCGDALLAGATLTLAAQGSPMQAAYIGNAAAAIEIGALGNHPVTAEQMRSWFRGRRELVSTDPVDKPMADILPPCTEAARHQHPQTKDA